MTRNEPTYGRTGDKQASDFPGEVVDLARSIAEDEEIRDADTRVTVTVREGDSGAEVHVDERGNTGLWIDESRGRPTVEGPGSPVSKRAQDIARDRFGHSGHVVTQYEDSACSETTIRPTAA